MDDSLPRDSRVVAALGGNALLRRGEPLDVEIERRNLRTAAETLAALARSCALVVTHGNGPQVGMLAELDAKSGDAHQPLDVLGAQTQGMLGYLIEDELRDALGGELDVATLLTQVEVAVDDPAFRDPTKPVGPVYSRARAKQLARERGFQIAADGSGWRRVVPSPLPRRILELRSIELLLSAGVLVVCAGGGGVPVVADPAGGWRGVEAVVDKDLSAALLADALGAKALLLLTDVDAVYERWGTDEASPIDRATPAALRRMSFAPGSMGPKVEAACRFVDGGAGRFAGIGALAEAAALLAGRAGTRIESPPAPRVDPSGIGP